MKTLKILLLGIFFGFFAHRVQAQGTITWAAGYPATSANLVSGISVKGSVAPDTGWKIKSLLGIVWISGKAEQRFPITKWNALNQWYNDACGNWVPLDYNTGQSGVTFNVIVIATMTNGTVDKNIITKPGTAKSK